MSTEIRRFGPDVAPMRLVLVNAEAGEAEAAELVAALTEPVLLVTVNGDEIYDNNNDFSYMQYYFQYMFSMYGYDVSDPTVALYVNQLALVNSIQHTLLLQKAKEKPKWEMKYIL